MMQIVRMQCPACGAPIRVPTGKRTVTCGYCRTQLAVVGDGQPVLRPATLPAASGQPPLAPPVRVAPPANGRGCLYALLMWFVGAPLLMLVIFMPVVLLFPSDAEGHVQAPDAVLGCLGILMLVLPVALVIYAFVYFRQRENGFVGFLVTPVRALVRRLRR